MLAWRYSVHLQIKRSCIFLCGDLTQAQGALLVFADGVPQNGGDVLHILQRAGQALSPQPLRVDFALLFARDELRLCKVELRGVFGDNSVSLVVAELARRGRRAY